MVYVALLRGINVGGNNKIEMSRLKLEFESLGFTGVKTYINSGNVIFTAKATNEAKLTQLIEAAIEQQFGFRVSVLLRNFASIKQLVEAIPADWVNDKKMKCDVLFLWKELDSPSILKQLSINPSIEQVKYFPGAVVWCIKRENIGKSRMLKLVGTKTYKQMTVRNPNTVRRLYELMGA
jgi:uncharacterized protein (DUF1697 family)